MRRLMPLLTLLLTACAGPLPAPDADKAWVELYSWSPGDLLMAERVDKQRWPDGRYFQVSPGAHTLEVRYRFEVYAGGGGAFREPNRLTCFVRFRYDGFEAGKRYRIEAREVVMRPQSWLYDSERNTLVEGEVLNCGPYG
jgi:hypothetical protein